MVNMFFKKVEVILKSGKDEFSGEGGTILEALQKIEIKDIKSVGTFTVIIDKERSEISIRISPMKLKLMFDRPFELEIFAKKLEILK